jgi:hypothetical protein
MRKLLTSGFVAALMIGITVLAGCSSGGSSESGLGLDVSGQWRGTMVERRSGRMAATISFVFQSDNNPLNPLFSTNHSVFGSIAFENFLPDACPIGSFVGTVEGTVVGNDLILEGESDDFFITLSGIVTNNTIQGDWNMHFEFEVIFVDEDGEETTSEAACNQFGTWSAVKTNS